MFISSYHDKRKDKIVVWEKSGDKRIRREYNCPYFFYVPDKLGDYDAITGEKLKKLTFSDKSSYDEACIAYPKKFESDLSPLDKHMMETYVGKESPLISAGFVDIEVDYDPDIGFAGPLNPYAPISAITIYKTLNSTYYTLLVPPNQWDGELPTEMVDSNYFICKNERELLDIFFDNLLDDVDILSGWNSDFYDIPYIAKRAELLYGPQTGLKKLAFDNAPIPYWSEQERFKGAKQKDLVLNIGSRVHLDYMRLFKKFNLEGRQSYSLGSIADDELHIPKMAYSGSLHDLYNGTYRPNLNKSVSDLENDDLYKLSVDRELIYQALELDKNNVDLISAYNDLNRQVKYLSFIKFAQYNRRDVEVLLELDKKFKYIELASQMVHEATVNFTAIFGSVQLIDTAIINFCHTVLNKIVFDKTHKSGNKVEGALVLTPKVGFHKMVGSVDLNSLYPSTYRSLNLSPEKIVGQLLEYEDGWRAVYEANLHPNDDLKKNKIVRFRLEGTDVDEAISITAGELIELLNDRKYAISAYGTVLDQGNGQGLLPAVLSFWFNGRKELQAKKKEFHKRSIELLKINGNNKEDPEYIELVKKADYYDMLQGVRKVLLNSTYGATLNEFCRFHDPRLGASTTGTGRQITTHMINSIAEILIGSGAPKVSKTISKVTKKGIEEIQNDYTINCPNGIGPIYSDTDSVSGDTLVTISSNTLKVEDAFNQLAKDYGIQDTNGKQMVWLNSANINALSLSGHSKLKGIYRHRTNKRRFRITLESGKFVDVTEDHSIMVERDGKLIEVKPLDINKQTDVCISVVEINNN